MDNFLDRIWQAAVVILGGFVSLFVYNKKKEDTRINSQDLRISNIELKQAGYDVTVVNIHEDIKELKSLILTFKRR